MDHEICEAIKTLSRYEYRGHSKWQATQSARYDGGEFHSKDTSVQSIDGEIQFTEFEALAIARGLKDGTISQCMG
jgi:hypothetical protein